MSYFLCHKVLEFVSIVIIVIFVCFPTQAYSEFISNSRLDFLWEEVLNDPNDSTKNIKYAVEAAVRGFHDRAISAFGRALNSDPNNDLARRKLSELMKLTSPGEMSGTFIVSSSYQSNGGQGRSDRKSDKSLSETLVFTDDRKLFGGGWKTTFLNFADSHSHLRGSDIIFTGLKTGPTVYMSGGDKIDLSVNVDNTIINKKIDSYSIGLIGEIEFENKMVNGLEVGFKYTKNYSEGAINYVNGFFSSLIGKAENILLKQDEIEVKIGGKLNLNEHGFNSSGSRDRLLQIDINTNYYLSFPNSHSIDFFLAPSYVHYFKHRIGDKKNREDLLFQLGFSYNIPIFDKVSLAVSFAREQRISNFREFKYFDNHIGTSLIFTF